VFEQLHDGYVGVTKDVIGQHIIIVRGDGFEHLLADGFGHGLMRFEVTKILIVLAIRCRDLGACSVGCVNGLWARMEWHIGCLSSTRQVCGCGYAGSQMAIGAASMGRMY
jgi:hypothetical protein